jgi:hypothetical protein
MILPSRTNFIRYSNYLKQDTILFSFCFLVIGVYFSPYFIMGKNASLLIHDNLDSNVVWVKLWLENGNFFSSPSTTIDQVFNGLSRSSIYATYDIDLVVFKFFGMYWGYVLNKLLIAIFAFVGMYHLLKTHFLPKDVFKIIPFGVALLFSLLPFWSFSMSVSGLPLLLYAFLNLRQKNTHFTNWLIILLFPFCSSLITSGVFFILIIVAILIRDLIKFKVLNYYPVIGLFLLTCMYCISHFPILLSFFSSQYLSHRVEFTSEGHPTIKALKIIGEIFLTGHYHAQSLHTLILCPILVGLYVMFKEKNINKRYIIILLFIFFTSVFYGLLEWDKMQPLVEKLLLKIPIQLQRFHWLHPMFWYVLFALSLSFIATFRFGKQIVLSALLFQFFYILSHHELFINRHNPSFREFYAEKEFKEIESFIGKQKKTYRVVSVGIHPSIAQFNGFYTLDGYFPTYPLEYKHQFRKIIAKELDKDSSLKNYFDNWGSRCYAFSAELGQNYNNRTPLEIQHLDFDYDEFKNMGGVFIISSAPINLNNNNRIHYLTSFANTDSYWKIYLYEVQ